MLFIISCENQDGQRAYIGHEYYKMQKNSWKIYQVDSTVYDDFLGQVIHYNYQVKELNKDTYTDVSGRENMKIEKYTRQNPEDSWKIKNVHTSHLDSRLALKTEDNVTIVKLVFPLRKNRTWNGNSYNNQGLQEYKILGIHEPFHDNHLQYDSTVTVMHLNFLTLISEDDQYEVYAAGVGLIKKKFKSVEKEIDGRINRGVDYTYTLIDKGYYP
jgi:hypothetical protein